MSGFAPSFCGDGTTSRRFLGAVTAVRMILEPRSPPDQKSWSSHTRASVGNVNMAQWHPGSLDRSGVYLAYFPASDQTGRAGKASNLHHDRAAPLGFLSARLEACGVVQRPIALSSSQAQNGNNVMNDKRSRLADTGPGRPAHAPTLGEIGEMGIKGFLVGQVPATHTDLGQRFLASSCARRKMLKSPPGVEDGAVSALPCAAIDVRPELPAAPRPPRGPAS